MRNEREVWATGIGRITYCRHCGQPAGACRCREVRRGATAKAMPQDGYVRILRDRKGRGGKVVTVIHGLPGDDEQLVELGKSLKRLCGSGGTVKDGVVEIQGDHLSRIEERLRQLGYTVKRVGG